MNDLNLVQAVGLMKLAEKAVKALGGTNAVEPGSYDFEFDAHVSGMVSKGGPTQATPAFRMETLYKAILLKYASGMDNPEEWLDNILSIEGALGATVTLGPDAVLKTVDEKLIALHDRAVNKAKSKFQAVAKKQDKSGSTTAVGELAVVERATA